MGSGRGAAGLRRRGESGGAARVWAAPCAGWPSALRGVRATRPCTPSRGGVCGAGQDRPMDREDVSEQPWRWLAGRVQQLHSPGRACGGRPGFGRAPCAGWPSARAGFAQQGHAPRAAAAFAGLGGIDPWTVRTWAGHHRRLRLGTRGCKRGMPVVAYCRAHPPCEVRTDAVWVLRHRDLRRATRADRSAIDRQWKFHD